mgnify:CR=1 FL=1
MQTQHDPAATKALIKELYPDVLRLLRTKIGAPDCYDQAQEAIKTFLMKDPSQIRTNPRGYLMGIARMRVLKYFSSQKHVTQFDSTQMSVAAVTSMSVRMDRHNQLIAALQSLTLDEQIAIEQHLLEGRTLEETALVLGVSRATATRRVSDGKKRLAQALTAGGADVGDAVLQELRAAYHSA